MIFGLDLSHVAILRDDCFSVAFVCECVFFAGFSRLVALFAGENRFGNSVYVRDSILFGKALFGGGNAINRFLLFLIILFNIGLDDGHCSHFGLNTMALPEFPFPEVLPSALVLQADL